MASPQATGSPALSESRCIRNPGTATARLQNTADPIDCPPDLSIYVFFPSVDNAAPQICQGGAGSDSFNRRGQVNSLRLRHTIPITMLLRLVERVIAGTGGRGVRVAPA